MASSNKVRWGIIGPGRIAGRLLKEVDRVRNATVVATASRSRQRADEFAARFRIARVHESYEALLADPGVDAVYIGLPNSLHHPVTMQALAAGKHVLCEKPYSRHPADAVEAFDAAQAKGLVLMEAFMWRHTPKVRRFMELLPEVGELRSIRATFSFVLEARGDVRLDPKLEGGALMDVGCYCVSGSRLVAGADPIVVYGEQTLAPSGVDEAFSGLLRFPSGVVAEIVAGFTFDHRSLEAIGSKANLLLRDPWLGDYGGIRLGDREIDAPAAQDAYRLELENMGDAILGKAKPLLGRADALGQARTIEALYRSADTSVPVKLAP
jgi:D-xylose 1-dehydrogenase (NADP+, D-xylono-1,5-lactone-forming)